jgi:hypothetical protein
MSRPLPVLADRRPDLVRAKGVDRPPQPIPSSGPIDYDAIRAIFGDGPLTGAAVSVSERNISGLPALERGVQMVSNAVATMMAAAEVLDDDDMPIIGPRPNIVARPAGLLGGYEFWKQAVETAMKRGNWIGLLADHDSLGYAQQVVPIHPDMVSLDTFTIPGWPLYRIGRGVFTWQEVVHVRSSAPAGTLWGIGIVEKFRRHLHMQLMEAEYARSAYAAGGPSHVVTLNAPEPTAAQVTAVKTGFGERFGSGNRDVVVVGSNYKSIEPYGWSPKDADWVNGSQLSIAQCAFMCDLRPEDLGAAAGGGGGMTYGNRTDDSLQRVVDSYSPWMHLFEDAWSDLLPIGERVRGKVEALLRSSTKERYEVHQLAQAIGIQDQVETRVIEHRPVKKEIEQGEPDQ